MKRKRQPKISTAEMEIALASHFRYWVNVIVPRVYWGRAEYHECDLLMVSAAGYLTEIEIKVSKADLKRDAEKPHRHRSNEIKRLFFALPDYLESDDCIDLVPERAGIIIVEPLPSGIDPTWTPRCREIRPAQRNKVAGKIDDSTRYKIARLGTLRAWGLKRKLLDANADKAGK